MQKLTAVLTLFVFVVSSLAAPYIPLDQIKTHHGETMFTVPEIDATYNHYFEYIQLAQFLQPLQYEFAGVNFGGEREEEIGGMYNIIETDNTLEAIWVWSRYYELTSDNQYYDEIEDAWIYAYQFPAWLEGAGYYSSHNCAWGLTAEMRFREVYNDSSHWNYAVNCANYIINTPLSFTSDLNVMVTGWCCGNLYLYGEAIGNDTYMQVAAERGREIMQWVEENPTSRLSLESWAMSSGTFIWGICNSTFRDDPVTGQEWLATYGPLVQVYEPAIYSWSNAWNVAYCNAQGGMYDVTGDPVYLENHLWLTNYLLSKDSDNDGGIPASASGSTNADASWTSAYLAKMGCDRYCGFSLDAGVMLIRSPGDHTGVNIGEPLDIEIIVGNWGLEDASGVRVVAEGVYEDTAFVDIAAGAFTRVEMGEWTPSILGIDSLTVSVFLENDENDFNDIEVSRFMVRDPFDYTAGSEEKLSGLPDKFSVNAYPNPFNSSTEIRFTLANVTPVDLHIFDIQGREVFTRHLGVKNAGEHSLSWNASPFSAGLYFVRIEAGNHSMVKKLMYVK